ncbi:MAG: HipA family kinase, partial [Candidatus Nanopelagicales bacterium]
MDPVRATRYVTPLREGGSLPGLMEADDLGMYVVKFTGAGQGPRALVAEVICAQLAAGLGLRVPRWVPVEVSAQLAPAEPDEEVQHLLRTSAGVNLGIDFLPGALDVGPRPVVDAALAGRIVWLDALVNNVDRTWRNPNLLLWHRKLHLIDHGAALTFHHAWAPRRDDQVRAFADRAYAVADHALLECGPDLTAADAAASEVDWPELVGTAVDAVPGTWLESGDGAAWGGVEAVRAGYRQFLLARIAAREVWVPALAEAVARGPARDDRGRRVPARRSSGPPDWIP